MSERTVSPAPGAPLDPDDDQDDREGPAHTILIVDDEPMTVSALRHHLRRQYTCLGATKASEAIDLLERHDVSIVICDERMPHMAGHQFLEKVSARWPHTSRILMTAYADLPALVRAVNHGQILGYLSKPWHPDELDTVIRKAVAVQDIIRDKQRVQADLERANDDLRRVVGKLRDFTHAVAHDLQEPLRTISAYASILQDDVGPGLEAEPRQFLAGISRCSEHLRSLIDDLLQFSEIERLPLRHVPIGLDDVVLQARRLLDGVLTAGDAEIHVHGPLPAVHGDPGRLVVLFQNLMSNGLKFNRSRPRRVDVHPETAGAGRVAITVRDNGIGIAPEHHDRVFQIFHRLHTKSEYPGTGAGLAIARQVAEVHGGSLTLSSAVGQGTTFRVELAVGGGAVSDRPSLSGVSR